MSSYVKTLSRLDSIFKGNFVVTGGLAFRWHMDEDFGRAINDIDIVTDSSHVPNTIASHFLITHFHPSRGGGRILIQLVDEEHQVRIDVFTPSSPTLIQRALSAEILGVPCRVVSVEDLFAKLLAVLWSVTASHTVDPKHYDKFNALARVAHCDLVEEIWPDYRKPDCPERFSAAAAIVRQAITEKPELLRQDVYSQEVNGACPWCEPHPLFPVCSPARTVAVLGYV